MTAPDATGRPTGQPFALDRIVLERNGQQITAEQRIIELLATGVSVEAAAGSIGVRRPQLHKIIGDGVKARTLVLEGKRSMPDDDLYNPPPLDDRQLRLLRFADAVDEARDRWAAALETRIETLTRPGTRTRKTTKRDGNGNIIEETTVVEDTDPDGATVRWRAERHPHLRDQYRPPRTELTGADGGPITVDIESKASDVLAMLRKLKEEPTEGTDTDARSATDDDSEHPES